MVIGLAFEKETPGNRHSRKLAHRGCHSGDRDKGDAREAEDVGDDPLTVGFASRHFDLAGDGVCGERAGGWWRRVRDETALASSATGGKASALGDAGRRRGGRHSLNWRRRFIGRRRGRRPPRTLIDLDVQERRQPHSEGEEHRRIGQDQRGTPRPRRARQLVQVGESGLGQGRSRGRGQQGRELGRRDGEDGFGAGAGVAEDEGKGDEEGDVGERRQEQGQPRRAVEPPRDLVGHPFRLRGKSARQHSINRK
jgi:hypothetical protein